MGEIHHLPCPGCGATISLAGSDVHATCRFCGHRAYVDPALQEARDRAIDVQELEREAWQGLTTAARAEASIRARTRALLAGVIVAAPIFPAAYVASEWEKDLDDRILFALRVLITLDALVALLVGGLAWLLLVRTSRLEAAVEQRLGSVQRTSATKAPSGKCPSCGAGVVAPATVASFECAHCRAPLVVARGILIRWVDDAKKRAESWKWEAFGTQLEAETWPRSTWVAFVAILILGSFTLHACMSLL